MFACDERFIFLSVFKLKLSIILDIGNKINPSLMSNGLPNRIEKFIIGN